VLPGAVLTGLSAALDAGKHVILLGPPGTGKTHLAELVGKAATHSHYAAGYLLTTASADWTTFDTIGGYMPNPKNPGELEFQPGVFLEALAADHWVVLDEINRADADKAFGALLTLLAGFDVKLSFRDSAGQRFRLVLSDGRRSRFDAATATYHVGQNWRIIATMNTRDKNSLFALSYAFMRRFSFVYIGPPTADELTRILRSSSSTPAAVSASLRMANEVSIPLGAALLKDIARYISAHDEVEQGIENAVIAYVLPQLEGRETKLVRADLTRLRQALGLGKEVEANWLSAAGVLLGVDGKAPPSAAAGDASELEDDIDLAE
jgi:MoxR-like ATPase